MIRSTLLFALACLVAVRAVILVPLAEFADATISVAHACILASIAMMADFVVRVMIIAAAFVWHGLAVFKLAAVEFIRLLKPEYRESYLSNGLSLGGPWRAL